MAPHLLDSLRKKHLRQRAGAPHLRRAPADMPVVDASAYVAVRDAPRRRRRLTALERLVDRWWTRLLQSVYAGSLSEQEPEYESGCTMRDYLWNTAGTTIWGASFPVLTVVATQLAGPEDAGMFSLAFVVGTLLMIATGFGVRNYQVSDIAERHSFSSYQVHRWICAALAIIAGVLYCSLRGYDPAMGALCMGVVAYKVIDGVADVYEGRLQQADKLYLAGISQTVRSMGALAGFTVALLLTRSIVVAAVAMAVAGAASLVLVTAPLALLETEKSRRAAPQEVFGLFSSCAPLFWALFLFNLIESMPKLAMEGALSYDNQLYFNALYFPAQGILLGIGFVYKPQLLRLAAIWQNPRRRRRFDLIIAAVLAVIVAMTVATGIFMGWAGIPLMSFFYGLDFEPMRPLAYLMVAAGGVTAAIDFLYAIVCVLRRGRSVARAYLVAFVLAATVPFALVALVGLAGAIASYLGVMVVLLVLLVASYRRIREEIAREEDPFRA